MLLDKLKETNKLIKDKQNIDKIEKELSNIETGLSRIKDIESIMFNYISSLRKLNSIDKQEFEYVNLSKAVINIDKVEKGLEKNSIDFEVLNKIKREMKNHEDELKIQWINYLKRTTEPLVNTISCLKNISNESQKINIIVNALKVNTLNNKYWPVNDRIEKIINDNIEECKKIISSLGVNKEIEIFLKKISDGNATIFDLKPNIMEWILRQGLQNKISLKFNNN